MLATERHSFILDELTQRGVVRIAALAEALDVSVMTVRRDIEMLAEQGLVNKVHGGATVKTETITVNEPPFRTKSLRELDSKIAMARNAATLVTPGASLALMGGSTVYALAKRLINVPADHRHQLAANFRPISPRRAKRQHRHSGRRATHPDRLLRRRANRLHF